MNIFDLKHKSAISDGTQPTYTSNLVYMCAGGLRGHRSSNRISIHSHFIEFLQFGLLWLQGVGQVGGGYLE